MKISACMITKNEEKNIARSILSYRDIVEEIIVVDSDSTDDTVKIAESLGAQVYTRPWTNDFAAAKNFAIDQAAGDWIVFLDADEYFDEGHAKIARKWIASADQQGYDFILSPCYETHGDGRDILGACYVERVFRQDPRIRYHNPVHEYLRHAGGSHRRLRTDAFIIFHTGYAPDLMHEKMKRNLKLLLSGRCEKSPMHHLYLMEVYAGLDRHDDVIREANLLMSMPGFREMARHAEKLFRAYIFKIRAMLDSDKTYSRGQVEAAAKQALRDFQNHPEVRAALSGMYLHYGEADQAIEEFEMALELSRRWSDTRYDNQFIGNPSNKFLHLAGLYRANGDRQGEARYLLASLGEDKKNESALFNFLTLTAPLLLEEKKELLGGVYDMALPGDLQMISKIAYLAGENDLFMDCILRLKETGHFHLSDGFYCRLLFLQGEYDEMIRVAEGHANGGGGDGMYGRILFEAKMAQAYEKGEPFNDRLKAGADRPDGPFLAEVTMDLLQAGREDLIRYLFGASGVWESAGMDAPENRETLEAIFEKYRRNELYQEIHASDCRT